MVLYQYTETKITAVQVFYGLFHLKQEFSILDVKVLPVYTFHRNIRLLSQKCSSSINSANERKKKLR
jgi:hypothetical protein